MAAKLGHLDLCKLIIENVEDKNPRDKFGWTPLHQAAVLGHLSVCKLILENVKDKNPADDEGQTPKDIAYNEKILGYCY